MDGSNKRHERLKLRGGCSFPWHGRCCIIFMNSGMLGFSHMVIIALTIFSRDTFSLREAGFRPPSWKDKRYGLSRTLVLICLLLMLVQRGACYGSVSVWRRMQRLVRSSPPSTRAI